MSKRKTKEEFIEESIKIHEKDRYDYNEVEYVNNNTKVEIYCNKCKKYFWQTPLNHLHGQGCPFCVGKHKNTQQFIQESQQIHGNKFIYISEYNGAFNKIKIFYKKCKKYFWQTPHDHLRGRGCPYCKKIKIQKMFKSNQQEFIKKAQKVHGKDRYDYSEVNYLTARDIVYIKCNICNNTFNQTPEHHLRGHGCPYCKQSKGEEKIRQILEYNNIIFESQKRFKNCKDKKPLPFDFYLPDYNICIEYQGKQHYKEGFSFHILLNKNLIKAKHFFKTLKKHDRIKKKFCKNNNIILLEIKYNDNIEQKLNEIIKKE